MLIENVHSFGFHFHFTFRSMMATSFGFSGSASASPWPLTTRPMLRRIGRTSTPPGRNRASTAEPSALHGSAEHVRAINFPGHQRTRSRDRSSDPREADFRSTPVGPQERMDWLIALERVEQRQSHLDFIRGNTPKQTPKLRPLCSRLMNELKLSLKLLEQRWMASTQ